jgi:hypothetical protein
MYQLVSLYNNFTIKQNKHYCANIWFYMHVLLYRYMFLPFLLGHPQASLYPQKDSWYSFLLEAQSTPGP